MSVPNPDIQIRWLIRRDMPEVLAIEQQSFELAIWCNEDFLHCLSQRNCIGMVAESNHVIAAFMIYELHAGRLDILNFAVAPDWRLKGIGRAMLQRLNDKLSHLRRKERQ